MRPIGIGSAGGAGSHRGLLRCASFGGDAPTRVVSVHPADGEVGVLGDSPVLVRLSAPVQRVGLAAEKLRVKGPCGDVPGRIQATSDGLLLIWRAEHPLTPGVAHFVVVSGLQDLRGREIDPHLSRFTPCEFVREDISE